MEARMARMSKEQFAQECARRRSEGLALSGNTYAIKEAIKASGGIWDGRQKAWLMPSQEALEAMKAKMKPSSARPPRRNSRSGCCKECGGRLSDFDRRAAAAPGYHFDCV